MAPKMIPAGELVLCATNESGLYEGHKALAAYCQTAGLSAQARNHLWFDHIGNVVLPYLASPAGGYAGETIKMALEPQAEAARDLGAYYRRHLGEFEGEVTIRIR